MGSRGWACALAWRVGVSSLLSSVASGASADTLRVGPSESYATPCEAIAAAAEGDEVAVAAGTYTDSCAIDVPGLTLRGTGERPKIDLSGTDHPAQYKGIYVVTAAGVTIENMELTGAHISADNGENGAGIRVEAADLTVRGCFIHDNQNGILGGTSGEITIEHSELYRNGMGDGCNGGGCTHNLYIANVDALHFRFNWSHGIALDTADKGHLLKSRAKANYIEYNRITGEDGADSYEIDLPNGGLAHVVGNMIEKGAGSGNGTLLIWGEEGASNPDKNVVIAYNTFVNDADKGTFISASGATLAVHDNLFVGPGTPSSSGALSADNLSGVDPLLVDRKGYDYHLQDGSPAIGKAVDTDVVPEFEYVHPLASMARTSAEDVGAFEHGTDVAAVDAGVVGSDAGPGAGGASGGQGGGGAGGRDGAGASGRPVGSGGIGGGSAGEAGGKGGSSGRGATPTDAGERDAGSDAASSNGDSSDCSCSVPGSQKRSPSAPGLVLSVLAFACFRFRRRRLALALLALSMLLACSDTEDTKGMSQQTDSGARDNAHPSASDAGDHGTGGMSARDASSATGGSSSLKDAGSPRDAGNNSAPEDAAAHGASTDGGTTLCPEIGWCELTDTHLESVCPDPAKYPDLQANEGCSGVINDWGGGIADEQRNRLLIWGGGHRGYFGNEVYALDLERLVMTRLNDPSGISGVDLDMCTSPEAYPDGRPGSRHTYDGLAYEPNADVMFSVGGAGIPCGYAVTGTWILDLATVDSTPLGGAAPWMNPKPDPYPMKATYGVVADYDANSKRIIVDDTYNLWSYDVATSKYAKLNDSDQTGAHIDYHMTGRVDPKRKLFVIAGGGDAEGGGLRVFDIAAGSAYAQQDWTHEVQGCDALLAATSPGLAYDPVQDRMVGWAGGDSVITLDLDAKRCTTAEYPDGPGEQNENGTFGRFRYFPKLGVFAVVNDYRRNAFVLHLTK